jgi:hypothetical protein
MYIKFPAARTPVWQGLLFDVGKLQECFLSPPPPAQRIQWWRFNIHRGTLGLRGGGTRQRTRDQGSSMRSDTRIYYCLRYASHATIMYVLVLLINICMSKSCFLIPVPPISWLFCINKVRYNRFAKNCKVSSCLTNAHLFILVHLQQYPNSMWEYEYRRLKLKRFISIRVEKKIEKIIIKRY